MRFNGRRAEGILRNTQKVLTACNSDSTASSSDSCCILYRTAWTLVVEYASYSGFVVQKATVVHLKSVIPKEDRCFLNLYVKANDLLWILDPLGLTQHFDVPFPGLWPVLGFWRGPPPGWSCRRSAAHSRCPRRSPTGRGWVGLSSGRRGSSSASASAVTLCSWPALLPPPPAPAAAVWGRDRWMVRSAACGSQTISLKALEPPAEN